MGPYLARWALSSFVALADLIVLVLFSSRVSTGDPANLYLPDPRLE